MIFLRFLPFCLLLLCCWSWTLWFILLLVIPLSSCSYLSFSVSCSFLLLFCVFGSRLRSYETTICIMSICDKGVRMEIYGHIPNERFIYKRQLHPLVLFVGLDGRYTSECSSHASWDGPRALQSDTCIYISLPRHPYTFPTLYQCCLRILYLCSHLLLGPILFYFSPLFLLFLFFFSVLCFSSLLPASHTSPELTAAEQSTNSPSPTDLPAKLQINLLYKTLVLHH